MGMVMVVANLCMYHTAHLSTICNCYCSMEIFLVMFEKRTKCRTACMDRLISVLPPNPKTVWLLMKFNDSSNKQWGECQSRLLSKIILGRAMGGGKLGGDQLPVAYIHFESLDLFLDMIRNKCIYENSINIKWVDFSFFGVVRLARFVGRGNYDLCILVSLKLTTALIVK